MEVENSLFLPDVAIVRFQLNDVGYDNLDLIPDTTFRNYLSQGQTLEIFCDAGSVNAKIFDGEITSVSLEHSFVESNGPMFAVVHAYDRSHRLQRGMNTKTYLNSKISDVVQKICRTRNLTAVVDQTAGVLDYLLQANQTDWDFLRQMARRVGYELYVKDAELHFESPQKSPGRAIELKWNEDLSQLRVRANTAFQESEVVIRGWDWMQQQPLIGRVASGNGAPAVGESRTGVQQASSAFGSTNLEVTDLPIDDQNQANTLAQSLANDIARSHIYAYGTTAGGRGDILPRKLITISGIGSRFSGTYYVTATTHRYNSWEGYTTSFEIGGQAQETLDSSAAAGEDSHPTNRRVHGVVTAVVTNVDDQSNLNRVKVRFPWMHDADQNAAVETHWARIATPDAGPGRGFQWLPEVDDEVLVAFEHGDVNRPFVIGSLWNGINTPPMTTSQIFGSGTVNKRVIVSRTGHTILLDDTVGAERIVIHDGTNNNQIVIDSQRNTLQISINQDVSIHAGGLVAITGAQAISITSEQSDVSVECENFRVSARQSAEISSGSAGVTLQNSGQVNVSGSAINLG
jgi:uncharacterized protein involved in type VI secretion and phage assembly